PWSGEGFAALGGTRPAGAAWYRLSPPEWMVEDGWSLTPEAGGRVHAEGTGPHRRPILAYVKRHTGPVVLLVGGYYLGDPAGATLRLRGESPLKYFGTPPLVRFAIGDQVLTEFKPDADFDWSIDIPAGALPEGGGMVTMSLDRAYLPGPAEGTSDQRRLGLR